ncbi:MAG: flagellar export chaperone FliS [Candidatus Caldatribacteriaceae bacterium]
MNAYSTMLVRNYQENSVNTASPLRLVIMLYQACIRALHRAEKYFGERDSVKAHSEVLRAEKIVLELMQALNFEQGGEIARNLFSLYQFILEQCALLGEENASRFIPRLVQILEGLQKAWQEIEKNGTR